MSKLKGYVLDLISEVHCIKIHCARVLWHITIFQQKIDGVEKS